MIPFGVIAHKYKIVDKADNCSCWYIHKSPTIALYCISIVPLLYHFRCLPFYGNVLPRAKLGLHNNVRSFLKVILFFVSNLSLQVEENMYLQQLHYFIASYATVLTVNFVVVLCCMAVTYYKIFRRIKRMILTQGSV